MFCQYDSQHSSIVQPLRVQDRHLYCSVFVFVSFDLALLVSYSTRLWDFLEVHEDERTGEEYAIFVLEDSDSETD